MSYGYTDSSEVGPGKQGGKFGLNVGAHVTKFEYNANGGKDGAQQDAIDFTVQIGEKEYMLRYFPVSKIYSKETNQELTDPSTEEYKKRHKEELSLLTATLSDIVKCFVSEEDLKTALATPISSFADYARVLERLVKSTPNWQKIPVDVFLEYQWKPTGTNTRTFLTLPKNVKWGTMITRTVPGAVYTEQRTPESLNYVDAEGNFHAFKRGKWYVENAFANPTILEQEGEAAGSSTDTSATGDNW